MKGYILLVLLLVVSGLNMLLAQNVGISSSGVSSPDPSAVLDVSSTDKGMLIPRVALDSTTDITTIPSPAVSLLVYNVATTSDVIPGFYFYNGSEWVVIGGGLNTDNQTLSLDADTLFISGGNSVILTDNINDPDFDPTNEFNQSLTLNGANLAVTDGGGSQIVDLTPIKDHDWYEVGGMFPDAITDTIYTMGNVGIGLANPGAKLEINSGVPNVTGLKFDQSTLPPIPQTISSSPVTLYSGASLPSGISNLAYRSLTDDFYFFKTGGDLEHSNSSYVFSTILTTTGVYSLVTTMNQTNGDLYYSSNVTASIGASNSILKRTSGGIISTITTGNPAVQSMALASNGDLYFAPNYYNPGIRVIPSGSSTPNIFYSASTETYSSLTFSAAGDLYAADGANIYKFTSAGVRTIVATGLQASKIAFSPTGQLFAAGGNKLYKVNENTGVFSIYVIGVGSPSDIGFNSTGDIVLINASTGELISVQDISSSAEIPLTANTLGEVVYGAQVAISTNPSINNSIPGNLYVNGSSYIEEDAFYLPWESQHTITLSNPNAGDLADQMRPYLSKYRSVKFVLSNSTAWVWNNQISLKHFQNVSISGADAIINMSSNNSYAYNNVTYKYLTRARIGANSVLSIGVRINCTVVDSRTISPNSGALFMLNGQGARLTFGIRSGLISYLTEPLFSAAYAPGASILFGHGQFERHSTALSNPLDVFHVTNSWGHPNTARVDVTGRWSGSVSTGLSWPTTGKLVYYQD